MTDDERGEFRRIHKSAKSKIVELVLTKPVNKINNDPLSDGNLWDCFYCYRITPSCERNTPII